MTCYECGRLISSLNAMPVRVGDKRAYLCRRCFYAGVPSVAPRLNPRRLYESFHGNPPVTRKVNLPTPEKGDHLVAIGKLVSVVYEPFGSSRLKGHLYEHKLGDLGGKTLKEKPILATDSAGKNLYIVPDKARPKFTSRGIIG